MLCQEKTIAWLVTWMAVHFLVNTRNTAYFNNIWAFSFHELRNPFCVANLSCSPAGASIPPTTMMQPFPPRLPPLRSPPFSSPSLPSPSTGIRGYDPRKNFFGITDARRRVLEHFGHKNQHLYEPGFLTESCKFRISSKCACNIVNRWKSCM